MKSYEVLHIENQLCFPLYACAKEVVRRYKPYLEPLGLTYTQYITMMVLWEYGEMDVEEAIRRLEGIKCGMRPTSCPDQIACALKQLQILQQAV